MQTNSYYLKLDYSIHDSPNVYSIIISVMLKIMVEN
jgi:hypothetical protein